MTKLTVFLLLVFSLNTSAESFGQSVSISQRNATLEEVFNDITKQTGYTFVYREVLLKKAKKVSISVRNVSLEQALELCLKDQQLSYSILQKIIVITSKEEIVENVVFNEPVPVVPVTGRVTNNKGEPLANATVEEKGAKNSTVTKEDGTFYLEVSNPQAILVVSYVGYDVKEAVVGTQNNIIISLFETPSKLTDVVVVGYGTQRRKDLTGSIASVNNREIKDLAITRIEQGLAGRAAGVQVKYATGEPGQAPQIRIRGVGSISAGVNPLYVVDGFPIDNIQTLNPNDIESMDILKDASATAIYGSRGSNGVIIINTKRGKTGKAVIGLESYFGWQRISKIPEMKNSKEQAMWFYDGVKNRMMDAGRPVTGDPTTWAFPVPRIIMDVLDGKNTTDGEALDEITVDAPQKSIILSASGGTEGLRYAFSGEYLDQDGIIVNSGFKRYSMRANFDAKLTEKLSLKVNLNPSYSDQRSLPSTGVCCLGSGVVAAALNVHNFRPLRTPTGEFANLDGLADLAAVYNPLAVAMDTKVSNKLSRLISNVGAEYKITNNLRFNFLLGASVLSTRGMLFKPQKPYFFNDLPTGSDNSSQVVNWLTEYTLNYNKAFGKHNFAALAGYTVQKETAEASSMNSNRYPNNLVPTLSAVGGLITGGTSTFSQWSLLSYLSRINYNYDSKYYLTGTIRADGSSRFGSENKYGYFPSFAVAWRISEESFFDEINFIDELKLRASYGETGNNNIGNYDQYATIVYENYGMGGAAQTGISPGRIPNPALTWEKQRSTNFGIDLSMFDRRINIIVDHFRAVNTDLLLNVNVPNSTGFGTALQNIGEVENKGWEFSLNTVNLRGAFEWTTDFNITKYENKVLRLGPNGDPIYAGNNVTMIGQPIGMFFGLQTDGIFMNADELAKGPIFNPGAADRSRVGDIRFKDLSGPNGKPDGVINSFDRTIIGSPYPDLFYGMTNRFTYKNISLVVGLQGSVGSEIYNMSIDGGYSGRGRVRGYAFTNNYWKSEAEPGDGITHRPNDVPTGGARQASTKYLDNGTYLRVNNITLSYIIPQNVSKRLGMSNLRVYANANNPFLFTKNQGFNPDVSMNDNPLTPGLESSNYPIAKSLVFGFNMAF